MPHYHKRTGYKVSGQTVKVHPQLSTMQVSYAQPPGNEYKFNEHPKQLVKYHPYAERSRLPPNVSREYMPLKGVRHCMAATRARKTRIY